VYNVLIAVVLRVLGVPPVPEVLVLEVPDVRR